MVNRRGTVLSTVHPAPATDTLRGVVERITYANAETGYTVAKLLPEYSSRGPWGADREITIVGSLADLNVGECVELTGVWAMHRDYGRQFNVQQLRSVLPTTVAGIEKYLGSGLIKGVGPVSARRITEHFGAETLDIIEHNPMRLLEVKRIGRKLVDAIVQAWAEQRAIKEVMIFLQGHGVSAGLATRIYKFYGDDSIAVVQDNPFRLAQDVYGIGFITADKIARALGIPADAPQRVAAGAAYVLSQATDEGHVFLPTPELISQTAELLAVTPQQVAAGIVLLWDQAQVKVTPTPGADELPAVRLPASTTPQLVAEQGHLYAAATTARIAELMAVENPVYLAPLYYSEKGVSGGLTRILRAETSRLLRFMDANWDEFFRSVEQDAGFRLAPEQQAAVRAALTHRLAILTGGPGTGKTTTVRAILALCKRFGYRTLLAAPTGRAAKRLAETTGQEAKTIHRLLEFKPSEGMAFKRNEQFPLEGDLLIVDEASMLDVTLTNHLLKAVPSGMHLLLVGDVDQLPSVGAGNILADLIAAVEERAPRPDAAVVRLQTIFRQAAGSLIITNAHRINHGELPLTPNAGDGDFFLFKTEDAERAAQLCVELVQTRIPRRFAIPSQDIQILSPMHRGVAGVGALNLALQEALNPAAAGKPQRTAANRVFRPGDRVMQVRNNYNKDVYNGDMGIVTGLNLELQQLAVMMDGREVTYDFLELDELVHAFAISVHKSQGSEFPAVVIPILTSHYMMLQRNLLYTAVSRARRLVVLVGQPKAIAMAVRNDKVAARYTGLRERFLAQLG